MVEPIPCGKWIYIYIYCIYIYVICISHIINNLNMPFGWYFKLIFVWHFRLWVGLRIDILAPVVLQMNPVDFWRATCSLAGRDGHVVTHLWWRREIFEHWIIASPIWNWVDEFILSILYIYTYIYIYGKTNGSLETRWHIWCQHIFVSFKSLHVVPVATRSSVNSERASDASTSNGNGNVL